MSLIHLYDPLNSAEALVSFASYNFDDHLIVLAAVEAQKHITIPMLDIRVIDDSTLGIWALNHQSLHNAVNSVFGIAGSDFTQIDFQDAEKLDSMRQLHAEEHRQWHLSLGL